MTEKLYYQDAYINGKWIYESSMYNERFIEANRPGVTALILVIAAFVAFIVAILIPLPVYALGAILPQLKKLGKPKYWYSLCIFAAIWTALTVLLFLVVILAVLI